MRTLRIWMMGFLLTGLSAFGSLSEQEFQTPPTWAGVRCWWWWLNSNVTKEAITRDLQEMKAKGYSGAMIFDAGGAEQRGNAQVPAGPLFASPQWIQLYLHALSEAQRLGLELGLSIQSGWNLGGPNVTTDFAAKQLTWSEVQIKGPCNYRQTLPKPPNRDYYRDICVLAFPQKAYNLTDISFTLEAGSSQPEYPPAAVVDGKDDTFWVSSGTEPGQGPSADNPQWLQFTFTQPVTVSGLCIKGRAGYGPRIVRLQIDGRAPLPPFDLEDGALKKINLDKKSGQVFRILFEEAYDLRYPTSPRNVQVSELVLLDEQGNPIWASIPRPGIQNLALKTACQELGMSAPDCRFLLDDAASTEGEEDVQLHEIQDISASMSSDGTLDWSAPDGWWTVLRFGYTVTDARVSTSSGEWKGRVIDYLSRDAFDLYWNQVVDPLLAAAGSLKGTVLKQLETDSWECGGMNWSPGFADDFKKYRRYDPIPWLPVVAGKIVQSRQASNSFLADLRKTLGDCVADNHYAVFAQYAHEHGLQIQPESGGPHAGPLDAIKNFGKSDIIMAEFWSASPHRPNPENRFFVKQAASAAHIYGRQIVAAESFTTIGLHWNDVPWKHMKPSMDHEFCSGLNRIFFHTFTCSPPEMGIPGQEYFAGTHVNPQVTWWNHSYPLMQYINRCQYMFQQGRFVADVLYYYGDHVPNIARLKEDDPAGVLPGYDYDITDEVILAKLKVLGGRIQIPGGPSYHLLAMPDHGVLSLEALEKMNELLRQGGTVLCPPSRRLVSLVGGLEARLRFEQLADQLWGEVSGKKGQRAVGSGRLIWGITARQALAEDQISPDFEYTADGADPLLDYIHYTVKDTEYYFVSNQRPQSVQAVCRFRLFGKNPQLWDPITGIVRPTLFAQSDGRTEIRLRLNPYGSVFVVFTQQEPPAKSVAPQQRQYSAGWTLAGPWQVRFDPRWGGPGDVRFDDLIDWTLHPDPAVKFYSGTAVYKKTFTMPQTFRPGQGVLLDLGRLEDVGIAKVILNGLDLGILWTPPFQADLTNAIQKGENTLEVEVVNSWRNRLIGDKDLPQKKRLTQTNITVRNDWKLQESGLLGPVQILLEQEDHS
jgi:hypothetical protein